MIPDAFREKLRLPEVGQICYVVPDINKSIAYCKDKFGLSPWMLLELRPDPCIQQGKHIHAVWKLALAYMGPVQVELIQVLEGESFHLRHVEESKEGVHHLGFMVQDINRRLDACEKMGIGVLQRGTIRETGVKADYAYLDTVEQAGIIIELIQWRFGPIPVPLNRLGFNLACRVGSKTLLRGRVIK